MNKERKKAGQGRRTGSGGILAREISLWALWGRRSIYKLGFLFLLMASAEFLLFWRTLEGRRQQGAVYDQSQSFEKIFQYSGAEILFVAVFCLVCLVLGWNASGARGSRPGYTLARLRVTGRHLFWSRTAYNFLCLVLLFAVQIGIVLGMCRMYRERMPEEFLTPQLEFLAFYRVRFLHGLLPLADGGKWAKNLLLLSALSMEEASEDNLGRGYKNPVFFLSMVICWAATGDVGFRISELWLEAVLVIVIVVAAVRGRGVQVSGKEEEEPESGQEEKA